MYIGIDLGTSSVKAILIDNSQKILATSHSPLTTQSPKNGYSEQNPEEWIKATHNCFQELVKKKTKRFLKYNFNRNIRAYAWRYST